MKVCWGLCTDRVPDHSILGLSRVSAGGSDTDAGLSDHKRHRQAVPVCSASSSDGSVSTFMVGTLQLKHSPMMKTGYFVSSPLSRQIPEEPDTSAVPLAVGEVDTSCWSTEFDGVGDDEVSGGNTSAFTFSEEGHSQQREFPEGFLKGERKFAQGILKGDSKDFGSDQAERLRADSWSGEGNHLQSQLYSFINKQKQKIESCDTDGSFGRSGLSLSGSLQGSESMGPERMNIQETSGSGHDSGSSSMSGFLGASSTYGDSPNRNLTGMLGSNHMRSMLLSRGSRQLGTSLDFGNALRSHDKPGEEERRRVTKAIRGFQGASIAPSRIQEDHQMCSHDLHQKFVLSSGRQSLTEGRTCFPYHPLQSSITWPSLCPLF